MKDIEDNISNLVETHFPQFYREEGNTFVDFVKEYYSWAESTNNHLYFARNLLEYRDIDKTIDTFLNHIKEKYMVGTKLDPAHTRFDLKHIKDVYTSKGTERGTKLFLNRVYGIDDVEIYFPGRDLLKPSDGEFYKPKYLELSISGKTKDFLGKVIVGTVSGAQAFVDNISRKNINGHVFDVAFISDIQGNFIIGENVTSDGIISGAPVVIGSITDLVLEDAGKQFTKGDVLDIVSERTGVKGKAIASEVSESVGSVSFRITHGGFGYSSNATLNVLGSSNTSITMEVGSKVTSNAYHTDFYYEELITQPLSLVTFNTANVTVLKSDYILAANSTGDIVGTGVVVGVQQDNAANGNILISNRTGDFSTATYFYVAKFFNASNIDALGFLSFNSNSQFANTDEVQYITVTGNTAISPLSNNSTYYILDPSTNSAKLTSSIGGSVLALVAGGDEDGHLLVPYTGSAYSGASIVSYTNKTATGVIAKSNTTHLGLISVSNTFTQNVYNVISGNVSGVTATVTEAGVGSDANANVGGVRIVTGVYLNEDILGSNNQSKTISINPSTDVDSGSDFISVANNTFTNNYIVKYLVAGGNTAVSGLSNNNNYYVVSSNSTGFKLSATSGGSAINLTSGSNETGHTFTGNTSFMNQFINSVDYRFLRSVNANTSANVNSKINEALTFQNYSLGTLTSLKNINPGQGYSIPPLIRVVEYQVEGSNKFNFHVSFNANNKVGNFSNGEYVDQINYRRSYEANVIGSSVGFPNTEVVTQNTGSVNVYGQIIQSNSSFPKMKLYAYISGTVDSTTTSNTVTGKNTYFDIELLNGDSITFSGCTSVYIIDTVVSNTELQLTTNAAAASNLAILKVSPFVNSSLSSALTGTVSCNTTSSRVNGSSTLFSTELAAGDFIKFSGNTFILQVNNIVSDTEMYLTTNSVSTISNTIFKANNVIYGLSSKRATFANVVAYANLESKATGIVTNVNNTTQTIDVERSTFDEDFTFGVDAPVMLGRVSGAYAEPLWITKTNNVMGNTVAISTSSANGSIVSLEVIDSGYAYQPDELIQLRKIQNVVSSITITNPGSGYSAVPNVFVSDTTNENQANVLAVINSFGRVSSITILNQGTGYYATPTITIDAPTAQTFISSNATVKIGNTTNTGWLVFSSSDRSRFQNNDFVKYEVTPGNVPVGDLVSNQYYFVQTINSTAMQLKTSASATNAVNLSGVVTYSDQYTGTVTTTPNTLININPNTNINGTLDFIQVLNNTLPNNSYVNYKAETGNTAITGLSNNGNYYVVQANSTGFKLSSSLNGSALNINTSNVSETGHVFRSNTHLVIGNNTVFTTELTSGDYIRFSGNSQLFAVNNIVNNTVLFLTTNSTSVSSNAYRQAYLGFYYNPNTIAGTILTNSTSNILTGINTAFDTEWGNTTAAAGQYVLFNNNYKVLQINNVVNSTSLYLTSNGFDVIPVTVRINPSTFTVPDSDFILIPDNSFSNGFVVTYLVAAGNTAMTNLSNNATYYTVQANSSGFKLATSPGGSAINLITNTVTKSVNVTSNISSSLDFINVGSNPFVNGSIILYSRSGSSDIGLSNNTYYYAAFSNSTGFKLATISGGQAVNVYSNATSEQHDFIGHPSEEGHTFVTITDKLSKAYFGGAAPSATLAHSLTGERATATAKLGQNTNFATAYIDMQNQGISEGSFISTRGFLNSDKYIHDNDFYQNYSYQIRTSISLEVYAETLKRLMHIAGTKLFGDVIKYSVVDGALSAQESKIIVE